jgi:hypothetical protein
MSYDVQSFYGSAKVYVRRIILRPPCEEVEVYCHSELSFAYSFQEPSRISSIVVDGKHAPVVKNARLYRIPEFGPTSTVSISVLQECVCYVRVYVLSGETFEDDRYHFSWTTNVQFFRSPSEVVEYARTLTSVRVDNSYWFDRIRSPLLSSQGLRDMHLVFHSYTHTTSPDWSEMQTFISSMPGLESLRVSHHSARPFVFEVFTNTPRKLKLDGNMELVGLERLTNVEDLTICSGGYQIPPEIVRFLPNLNRLSLAGTSITFALTALRMTELKLYNMSLTFTDCVTIGRLLRRNQLAKLDISRCPHVRKHGFRPVLMPLLDGSNTSLLELRLLENDLSKHVYYMLEDIVYFCPTLQRLVVPSGPFFDQTVAKRQSYFSTLGNVRIASKSVSVMDGSALARALTVTQQCLGMFAGVYRRKNRVWHQVGTREVVCAPLEFDEY